MTFMDSLASNPSSGIYGQPSQQNDELSIVNRLKDREMQDYQNKANFNADLSLRQEARMRSLFSPENQGQQEQGQQMNTVTAHDPNAMTGYQKGELGVRQQGLNLESQRLTQQGKIGEESIGIRQQQEKLNELKNSNIHEQKINEANNKVKIAEDRLKVQGEGIENLKLYRDAVEERHKLEAAKKDAVHEADKKQMQDNFNTTHSQMQQKIDILKQQVDQGKESSSTATEYDESGKVKGRITRETKKGASEDTIEVVGPNGQKGRIPKSKLNDWNKNHVLEEQ